MSIVVPTPDVALLDARRAGRDRVGSNSSVSAGPELAEPVAAKVLPDSTFGRSTAGYDISSENGIDPFAD